MKLRNNDKGALIKPGDDLIGYFQGAVANQLAVLTAQQTATQTEQQALAAIQSFGNSAETMVSPQDIPQEQASTLARESMEAHLQKVQSVQLSEAARLQNASLQQKADSQFKGKKVVITVRMPKAEPIEAVFVDKRTGQERVSLHRGNSIKGYIDTILLDKNLLVLRPSLTSQLITPNRRYYLVHMVLPDGLQPTVDIAIK